ncbi:MAG: peptide/nickel transport system permease protein, partial [Myxococcales bacterium]|nr:peptide/nickel transport system permease protein [Myxococcales bacterium]
MMARIARRLLWAVFVVWATVTLAFLVSHALPADPARMVAGPQARPQDIARIRKELGLDQSLYVQYARFMGRLVHVAHASETAKEHATCASIVGPLHLDLGKSAQQRRPVVTILAERLPRTIWLAVAAAFVQVLLGVTAGVIAAARKKTIVDHLAVSGSLLGTSAPTFVIALSFQWLFAHRLGLLPIDGWGDTTLDHVRSVILPALTLGVFGAAYYTRLVRDEMIGQLGQDYVRTARAKGLSGSAVVIRHALRNALMPVVTIIGVDVGTLVGGAIVTET